MTTHPDAPLESLVGMTVTHAEIVHDYIQLTFETDTGVSIFNDWHFVPETEALHDLIGRHVTAVHSSADAVVLAFDTTVRLIVDLSPTAWNGPEALQLNRADLPTVIWS